MTLEDGLKVRTLRLCFESVGREPVSGGMSAVEADIVSSHPSMFG
jgi:hypothetical protein